MIQTSLQPELAIGMNSDQPISPGATAIVRSGRLRCGVSVCSLSTQKRARERISVEFRHYAEGEEVLAEVTNLEAEERIVRFALFGRGDRDVMVNELSNPREPARSG